VAPPPCPSLPLGGRPGIGPPTLRKRGAAQPLAGFFFKTDYSSIVRVTMPQRHHLETPSPTGPIFRPPGERVVAGLPGPIPWPAMSVSRPTAPTPGTTTRPTHRRVGSCLGGDDAPPLPPPPCPSPPPLPLRRGPGRDADREAVDAAWLVRDVAARSLPFALSPHTPPSYQTSFQLGRYGYPPR